MADGFALALQKGIRAALAANAGVTAIVGTRIYDEPPQNVTFPYIRFGDIEPSAFDTDTIEGSLAGISIEAHSRTPSGRWRGPSPRTFRRPGWPWPLLPLPWSPQRRSPSSP